MNKQTFGSIIGGLILMAVILWMLVVAFEKIFVFIGALNPTTAAAIFAAMTTIIVSVISIIIAKRLEYNIAIINKNREKKVPVYESLMKFLFKVIFSSNSEGCQVSEKEMQEFFAEFTRDLIIWGSDDVIEKYRKFKVNAGKPKQPQENALIIEEILVAIRKDLGHKNKNFRKGHLLGLFINDLDSFI